MFNLDDSLVEAIRDADTFGMYVKNSYVIV
jgi:hypothetical protein